MYISFHCLWSTSGHIEVVWIWKDAYAVCLYVLFALWYAIRVPICFVDIASFDIHLSFCKVIWKPNNSINELSNKSGWNTWFDSNVIKYGLVTPTYYSIHVLCHLVVTMKNLNHWMDEKQNLPKRMQNVELTPSSKHHSICHQKMMLCLFCIFSFSYSS